MAAYLLNQTPVSSLSFQTPISTWVATSPSTGTDHLHPFGCTAVIHLPKERQTSKVSPTGVLCSSELISDPEVVEALLDKRGGTSPEAVIVFPPQPIASLEKPLPKGWMYKQVAETTPKDITSVVSMEHFVSGKRSRQPPNWFSGVVVGMVPCSFGEAMASLKSNALLNASAGEFASPEQHQVVKEVRRGKNQRLLDTTWVFHEKTNA
ncbi:hypothetical protein O181_007946 [Austropuccinia psidii MF-1]|uniref:Uncharacterized protein n=1 Tax=Austropuccinia psidii MF-1 TaxID=1389203 RepID=A0A9Q3BNW8_9BASI|nr:hypothetical protein [Austropuccinia psidii MF-1]